MIRPVPSTRAVPRPARGLHLRQGEPHPVSSSHRRGVRRAHVRAVLEWCVNAPAPYPGAPPSSFVAPPCRDGEVLPFASASCPYSRWPSRFEVRAGVAGDRPTGARRNTGAATAAVCGSGVVARRRALCPSWRVGRLGDREPALLRGDADGRGVPGELRRRVRTSVGICRPLAAACAAVRGVSRLVASGVGCVAEHVSGLRAEVSL